MVAKNSRALPPLPCFFLSFFTCLCSPFSSSSFTTSCSVNPTLRFSSHTEEWSVRHHTLNKHQSRRWASFMTEQQWLIPLVAPQSSQVSITSRLFPRHGRDALEAKKNQSPMGLLNMLSKAVWECECACGSRGMRDEAIGAQCQRSLTDVSTSGRVY